MSFSLLSVLMCIIFLCVGVCGGYFLGVAKSSAMRASLQTRVEAQENTVQLLLSQQEKMEQRNETNQRVLQALAPIQSSLEVMDRAVRNVAQSQVQQRTQLTEQFNYSVGIQEQLAKETQNLRGALTSHSARGMWGEIQLRRIVEAAGMLPHVDFDVQVSLAGGIPDMLIHLPGDSSLAVDAKVPLSAVLRFQEISGEADSESERQKGALLKQHAKDMRQHVKELHRRNYPSHFPGSPSFTVMYVPSDYVLALAMDSDPELLEYAYSLDVIPVSSTSLFALLRSTAALWASAAHAVEAEQIVQLGKELVSRLTTFVGHMENLGKNLASGLDNYNKAVGSLENRVLVTARNLASLDTNIPAPTTLDPGQIALREFTSPTDNGNMAG